MLGVDGVDGVLGDEGPVGPLAIPPLEYVVPSGGVVVDVCVDSTNMPSGGVTVLASECGLSTISCVIVTGAENPNHYKIVPEITAETGAYASASSFKLHYADDLGSASTTSDTNVGSVRLRVFGNL